MMIGAEKNRSNFKIRRSRLNRIELELEDFSMRISSIVSRPFTLSNYRDLVEEDDCKEKNDFLC